MVIMAGMLPGVECARRRRLRHHPSGEAPARRASLCLYASERDLGSSSSSSSSSAACSKDTVAGRASWALDSSAREAKERLDQKLRGHREPVVTRHQMSTRPPPAKPHLATCTHGGGTDGDGLHGQHPAAAPCVVLQQEVVSSKKGGGRGRLSWCRRLAGQCGASQAEAVAECAVCLEELRAGDVAAHLPCAHRFHWSCAVPWVQAASRCPVCRAIVHTHPAAAAAASS